jgi:peptidoglycan/LPS O-acetylase OafA/YrhL
VAAVLGYVTNWLWIYGVQGPFDHTWSLAIEEQFYLVWPVLLLALLRGVRSHRRLAAGLLTAAAGSLVARLTLAWLGEALIRIYVGTDTHADGLLLGAALAMWCHARGGKVPAFWRRVGGAGAGLGLLWLLVVAPQTPGYAWGVSAVAACATGGVICALLARDALLTRWLAAVWLVWIGRISYGVYLWHWPIFGQLLPPGEATMSLGRTLLAWALTFAVAGLSYWLVERRFLTPTTRRPSARESGGTSSGRTGLVPLVLGEA